MAASFRLYPVDRHPAVIAERSLLGEIKVQPNVRFDGAVVLHLIGSSSLCVVTPSIER